MKKFFTIILASFLLVSCGNNNEQEIKTQVNDDNINLEIDGNIKVNTSDDGASVTVGGNTVVTDDSMDNENTTNNSGSSETSVTIESETKVETSTETSTDEEALEAEVNDLLDEFIDSLDSYDK